MGKYLRKLLEISSPPFVEGGPEGFSKGCPELLNLLKEKNGFFSFEGALRVFPDGESSISYSLRTWNSAELWKASYGSLTSDLLFFAEDVFGVQFCFKDGKIYSFDPEAASVSFVCNNLEDWAAAILDDYNLMTGYSLAHEWQKKNGAIAPLDRLMPKIPFICGGEFSLKNLTAIDAAKSMRSRGNLACQIHSLPDGAQITFEIVD